MYKPSCKRSHKPNQPIHLKSLRHAAIQISLLAFFMFFLSLYTACGLEVILFGLPTGQKHEPPKPKIVTKLQGQTDGLRNATITIRAGNAQIAQGKTDSQGAFNIELPKGTDFFNLTIEVQKGMTLLKTLVPNVPQQKTTSVGTINILSTAITFALEGKLSAAGLQTINYPREAMKIALAKRKQELPTSKQGKRLIEMLKKLHQAASKRTGDQAIFQQAKYRAAANDKTPPAPEQSGLNPNALGNGIDYCSKGTIEGCKDGVETTTQAFDLALAELIQSFTLPHCTYGSELRVVITTTINPNAKDGNCSSVKQFKNAKRYGGTSCQSCKVYLTGGVHKDSGIIAPKVSQMLGNWEPNQVQMYDDGTHGDLISGDGIWTLVMALPAPIKTKKSCNIIEDCEAGHTCLTGSCYKVLRIGYKFTFGQNGDVWGGTEEFPGNQRILEIVDQNGDGFVSRHDNFADETGNKDKVNTLQKKGATGLICFSEPPKNKCEAPVPSRNHPDCGCKVDQNGDGIPDARERPWDIDQDCKPDGFRVFANAQPITKSCR